MSHRQIKACRALAALGEDILQAGCPWQESVLGVVIDEDCLPGASSSTGQSVNIHNT